MRDINWTFDASEQLHEWISTEWRTAKQIMELALEASKTPTEGKGKPEQLKHNLTGFWSKRIDKKHRLIYMFDDDTLFIIGCYGHYED